MHRGQHNQHLQERRHRHPHEDAEKFSCKHKLSFLKTQAARYPTLDTPTNPHKRTAQYTNTHHRSKKPRRRQSTKHHFANMYTTRVAPTPRRLGPALKARPQKHPARPTVSVEQRESEVHANLSRSKHSGLPSRERAEELMLMPISVVDETAFALLWPPTSHALQRTTIQCRHVRGHTSR